MCPACGSDDYMVMDSDPDTGEPDYQGEKVCDECGEVWV